MIAENILNVDNMMAIGGGAAGSASMAGTITILKVGEQAKAYIAPVSYTHLDVYKRQGFGKMR